MSDFKRAMKLWWKIGKCEGSPVMFLISAFFIWIGGDKINREQLVESGESSLKNIKESENE